MNKICLVMLLVFSVSCSNKNREVTIFSIPDNSTPSKLKENGFFIERNLNYAGETDQFHDGKILYCALEMGYATVRATYGDDDTAVFKTYSISIDSKPFEKMTGLKAKAYESTEIEGYDYKVEISDDGLSLVLKRLGL